MIPCLFHKLVLKYSLISQSGLLLPVVIFKNYLGWSFSFHIPCALWIPPLYRPLSCLQHQEDGYKDSRLRICFRVKSNGEFKCSCLPSCNMIYLKHPSFGIQLKHLTSKKRSYRHWSVRNQMHAGYAKRPQFLSFHCPDSWLFLIVVKFFPWLGETKSCRRWLIILTSLA